MAASRSTLSELAEAPEPTLRGRLDDPHRQVPVTVACASRLSLHVAFDGPERITDGTVFGGLTVETQDGDQPVRLGACRFTNGGAARGFAGRLVFTTAVYDCRTLIDEGKVVELRGSFESLPLVLSQKEHVRPEFSAYVADLLYDLSVYRRFFDDQDRMFADEPADAAEAARSMLLHTEGRRFLQFFDRKLAELEQLVQGYTKEEHERHGFYLRRQVWHHILESQFLKRTNLKPRGYAGDAEMMQMLYENAYVGTSVFGQLLHKHPVETPAAEAVRNRRRLIPNVLREVLARFPHLPKHGFRFLSLASGPAWEMQDLFLQAEDFERFHCALLDQDGFALELARDAIRRIERTRGVHIDVRYLNESVRTMLRSRDLPQQFGRYHFIYSMGLFDYLTPPVAKAVLAKTFELLLPGGIAVVGNYHVRNPTRRYMDYWMDWALYYRTEQSFLALAEGLPVANARITFDESGCQMFLHLERPAEPSP